MEDKNSLFALNKEHEVDPKRRKITMINSSNLSPSNNAPLAEREWNNRTSHLAALRCRILQAGAIAVKFQEMKVQIEEIIKEEENKLDMYAKMNREMMEQFNAALKPSMSSPLEDSEAEAAAEVGISQIKRRINVKLANLLTGNPRRNHLSHKDTSTSSKIQVELSQMLKAGCVSQKSDCTKIQELHSNKWKKTLSTNDFTPILLETATGKREIINIPKRLGNTDQKERLLMFYASSDSGTLSAAGTNERPCPPLIPICSMQKTGTPNSLCDSFKVSPDPIHNEDSSPDVVNGGSSSPCPQSINRDTEEQSSQHLCLMVGNYHVLVSDPRYFKIDWRIHYKRVGPGQFMCRGCLLMGRGAIDIIDHIWTTHYGGTFKCPLCPHGCDSYSTTKRYNVGSHIKHFHRIDPGEITQHQQLNGFC